MTYIYIAFSLSFSLYKSIDETKLVSNLNYIINQFSLNYFLKHSSLIFCSI